jgi:F-type H+-transporting ATPase subunit c
MFIPEILHALSVGVAVILGGIGSGIGQGIAGLGALQAISRQSKGSDHVVRTMILGLALIESGVILALVITLMILFGGVKVMTIGLGGLRNRFRSSGYKYSCKLCSKSGM